MPSHRKNKEYYAVVSERLDVPTIFSSWGDAHPRVTGCPNQNGAFFTIEEAREYMTRKGLTKYNEVIKKTALDTTPQRGSQAFYAVAHGRRPGIYPYYFEKTGAEREVNEVPGACHKRFRTLAQAEALIEDWKEAYADVWQRAIKEGLDQGFRPQDMTLSVEGVLHGADREDVADELDRKLTLKEEE